MKLETSIQICTCYITFKTDFTVRQRFMNILQLVQYGSKCYKTCLKASKKPIHILQKCQNGRVLINWEPPNRVRVHNINAFIFLKISSKCFKLCHFLYYIYRNINNTCLPIYINGMLQKRDSYSTLCTSSNHIIRRKYLFHCLI